MSITLDLHKTKTGSVRMKRIGGKPESSMSKPSNMSKQRRPFWFKLLQAVFFVFLGIAIFRGVQLTKHTASFFNDIGYDISLPSIGGEEPKLKTDSTGRYTNVLAVGIDQRSENSRLENTDTIMVISFNHDTNAVVMISIPRDTMVRDENGYWHKINAMYSIGERRQEGGGMEYLKGIVEDYTGMEIQYWGMINLEGFREIIDIIGGIDVDVENPFVDYQFPNKWDTGVITVRFDAGMQHMDGETALQYARSRHAQGTVPGYKFEGSDFARARRQQKVIDAVRQKLISTDGLLSPTKFTQILGAVKDNIQLSPFKTEDIQAGIALLKDDKDMQTYSFVLDPTIGGLNKVITRNVPVEGYAIGPVDGIGENEAVRKLVKEILTKPGLYSENASIRVYDIGVGYREALATTQSINEEYPYLDVVFMGTLYADKPGSYVYTNSSNDAVNTQQEMAKFLQVKNTYKPNFVEGTLNNEDVTILLGAQ